MQIPNLIRNFIRKRIVSECILLPSLYPDEGEFESFQEGYRLVGRKTGEELADDTPGQWRKSWRVIARNGMDDPFFVDFALGGRLARIFCLSRRGLVGADKGRGRHR